MYGWGIAAALSAADAPSVRNRDPGRRIRETRRGRRTRWRREIGGGGGRATAVAPRVRAARRSPAAPRGGWFRFRARRPEGRRPGGRQCAEDVARGGHPHLLRI